jgi:hypothetical protein
VRATIASPETRVIGIVLNAVDDFLLKSDQVRPRWAADDIPLLGPILAAAEESGRIVVITSDHGHVLDSGCEGRSAAQSDRWRPDDGRPADDEVVLGGRRVAPEYGGRVIAPWSEQVRYCGKKNGYHGGANPQEVVVPLAVLASVDAIVGGWEPTAVRYPDWWEDRVAENAPKGKEPVRYQRPRPSKGQAELPGFLQPAARPAPPRWIEELFRSEVYAAQKKSAGRVVPPEDKVRAFLQALDERGGKLTRAGLAQKLGMPPVRLQGLIIAIRRVLNVEGYDVLAVDEASDSVELNLSLLRVQFDL